MTFGSFRVSKVCHRTKIATSQPSEARTNFFVQVCWRFSSSIQCSPCFVCFTIGQFITIINNKYHHLDINIIIITTYITNIIAIKPLCCLTIRSDFLPPLRSKKLESLERSILGALFLRAVSPRSLPTLDGNTARIQQGRDCTSCIPT